VCVCVIRVLVPVFLCVCEGLYRGAIELFPLFSDANCTTDGTLCVGL